MTADSKPALLRDRLFVLAAAVLGWIFAGVQLGLMPLASLSVSQDLMGEAYTNPAAGLWFSYYTAALMLGAACGGILFGNLGDRHGRARTLGVCILTFGVFGIAGYFASNQSQLLVLRFIVGLGIGGTWPNGVSLMAEFWSGLSRPTLAGLMGMGANVGILLMSQFGRILTVTPETWRELMVWAGMPGALGVLVLLRVPESPQWLQMRGITTKKNIPMGELLEASLRRTTLVGTALGAIPLVGAWAASKWMIPWADVMGQAANEPGYKASTQMYWAIGATIGGLLGGHVGGLLGRRLSYFVISLASTAVTLGVFLGLEPLHPGFLPAVFVQGVIATMFFGWLPLYLPELFPVRVRASGTGIAFNSGRFISAAGVLAAGGLIHFFQGSYPKVGAVTGLVYALGMIVIWFAPKASDESKA
ncbi:MAG: MFS transporter [Candidatus Hydrogenedentota bacterium]